MAYSTSNPPMLVSSGLGGAGKKWTYESTDSLADVLASGYFTNGDELGMDEGDEITIKDTTAKKTYANYSVSTVVANGAATVSDDQNVQELTASGAVTNGVQRLQLNHASVVIASTIADFADHAGIFIVENTSASGTAAHTLTLTSGTFDGTNNIATLNAPSERLVVMVDGAGAGTVIENTGAVALST